MALDYTGTELSLTASALTRYLVGGMSDAAIPKISPGGIQSRMTFCPFSHKEMSGPASQEQIQIRGRMFLICDHGIRRKANDM